MTTKFLLDITKFLQKCPKCKSEKLDGLSGSLEVTSSMIRRTCACGYEISLIIDEKQNIPSKKTAQDKANKIDW